MKYLSLYRKYRPQNFDQIKGQDWIIKALKNSIKNKSFSHAYLFSGSRGTGKTTTAKVMAKAINCLGPQGDKPCNKCEICVAISAGKIPDVIEFDAASNKGVSEIREIISNVNLMPFKTAYKVYIIDEIHMLSIAAFNALLKTLEEPPAHIIFIFATTEYNKVPATIVSRCQQYLFRLISVSQLEISIKEILDLEKVRYEKKAIHEISLLAQGSLRDALSILEQVIMYCDDGIITNDIVYKLFSLISYEEKIDFIHSLLNNDKKTVLKKISEFKNLNISFDKLILDIITILKEALEYKLTEDKDFLKAVDAKFAIKITNICGFEKIEKILTTLIDYLSSIKTSNIPEIYFELAIIMCLEINLENNVDAPNAPLGIGEPQITTVTPQISVKEYGEQNTPPQPKPPLESLKKESTKILNAQRINVDTTDDNTPAPAEKEFPADNESLKKYLRKKSHIFHMEDIPLDRELILKVIIKADKENRKKSEELIREFFNDKFADKKQLISLYNLPIKAASQNYVIVTTATEADSNWVYSQLATHKAEKTLSTLFKKPVAIIAVSDKEWLMIGIEYRQLQQADKLPDTKQIKAVNAYFESIRNYYPQDNLVPEAMRETKNFKMGKLIFNDFEVSKE